MLAQTLAAAGGYGPSAAMQIQAALAAQQAMQQQQQQQRMDGAGLHGGAAPAGVHCLSLQEQLAQAAVGQAHPDAQTLAANASAALASLQGGTGALHAAPPTMAQQAQMAADTLAAQSAAALQAQAAMAAQLAQSGEPAQQDANMRGAEGPA